MGEEYYGCQWLEGGLAFNRRSLHSCLIVHHDEGLPFLCDYNGGDLPIDQIIQARRDLADRNRRGEKTACTGCPHLVKRHWTPSRYPFTMIGVAHFSHCNIECNYCFLQTQDPKSFEAGFKPYAVLPVFRKLIDTRALSPSAIIDWGGGEPSIYREFDELMALLSNYGCFHYLHTNAVRLPPNLRSAIAAARVHVICSVDAGYAETYIKMKKRDVLDQVWRNLQEYRDAGCLVTVKYIVREDNCAQPEIEAFLQKMEVFRFSKLLVDIDYDYPVPTTDVLQAAAALRYLASRRGIHAEFGFTGAQFSPEVAVSDRLHRVLEGMAAAEVDKAQRNGRALIQISPAEASAIPQKHESDADLMEEIAIRDRRIEELERTANERLEKLRVAVAEIWHLRAEAGKMESAAKKRLDALIASHCEADSVRHEAVLREQDQFALTNELAERAKRIEVLLDAAQTRLEALHTASRALQRARIYSMLLDPLRRLLHTFDTRGRSAPET
jgi:organic radical activating enzyme